jgi:hypothetical protein
MVAQRILSPPRLPFRQAGMVPFSRFGRNSRLYKGRALPTELKGHIFFLVPLLRIGRGFTLYEGVVLPLNYSGIWSERWDSNPRDLAPEASALGQAGPRSDLVSYRIASALLVPSGRIGLPLPPYHGGVLPLNREGILVAAPGADPSRPAYEAGFPPRAQPYSSRFWRIGQDSNLRRPFGSGFANRRVRPLRYRSIWWQWFDRASAMKFSGRLCRVSRGSVCVVSVIRCSLSDGSSSTFTTVSAGSPIPSSIAVGNAATLSSSRRRQAPFGINSFWWPPRDSNPHGYQPHAPQACAYAKFRQEAVLVA